jgi:DNA ligase 1
VEEVKENINKAISQYNDDVNGLQAFASLFYQLATSTKTTDKLNALTNYFATAGDKDKVWVIAIFSGRRPRRIASANLLAQWCIEITGLPGWLFGESYSTVGDLGETLALLLPETATEPVLEPVHFFLEKIIELEKESEAVKKEFITSWWMKMTKDERLVFNKLLSGSFRIGVSQKMMVNALAKTVDLPSSVIAHRISGNWDPSSTLFNSLLSEEDMGADISKPYPFYLAYAIENEVEDLGNINDWQPEWKWDGIRGQIIKRNNEFFVWSRGEELVTEKFPEYDAFKNTLPDGTVLDGEIICIAPEKVNGILSPLPFAVLQTRIGRKNITKKQLTEAPVSFIAYDLLEWNGEDFREKPLTERRQLLEKIIADIDRPALQLSPVINVGNWQELREKRIIARDIGSEGVMLKRKGSAYQVGRKRGDWWKWKIDPLTIDAVMIYAQKGSGRRSNLYTDYTFAGKDEDKLVSFTKAYSGLTDKEFNEVDNFVKRNSIEKFGPVRTVKPELVFEIAFEGIAASNRHKSGVALRFPRISRWRKDKKPDEINTLDDLKQLLKAYNQVHTDE